MHNRLLAAMLLLSLLFRPGMAAADDASEPGSAAGYHLSTDAEQGDTAVLCDGRTDTSLVLKGGQRVVLSFLEGAAPAFVSVRFRTLGGRYDAAFLDAGGQALAAYSFGWRDLGCLLPVPADARTLFVSVDRLSRLSELLPLAQNDPAPDGLHPFLPVPAKADLMVVSAHPDDEIVMFGGLLPTYAGERGYACEVVYMTMQNVDRYHEAHNGLWTMGVRNLPVVLEFRDVADKPPERYEKIWGGLDRAVGTLVSELRRAKPLVVVTHDELGEYGHGAHMATSKIVRLAVEAAADPLRFPDSAALYGPWQVQKLYLHLSSDAPVVLDFSVPLTAFGGRTALDVAEAAFACHVSQRGAWRNHLLRGTYDCRRYGLVFSAVGADVARDDLFEHIPPELLYSADRSVSTP